MNEHRLTPKRLPRFKQYAAGNPDMLKESYNWPVFAHIYLRSILMPINCLLSLCTEVIVLHSVCTIRRESQLIQAVYLFYYISKCFFSLCIHNRFTLEFILKKKCSSCIAVQLQRRYFFRVYDISAFAYKLSWQFFFHLNVLPLLCLCKNRVEILLGISIFSHQTNLLKYTKGDQFYEAHQHHF